MPLFSVIIPTYHRNDLLAKCLDCLAPGVQTLPIEQYEVIVTDDGRETTAEEMMRDRYPWAKWVDGPGKGPAANRNNGAKYAQGEWLAFTDDDCLPDPNWLKAFAEAITETSLALEGCVQPQRQLTKTTERCPVNMSGGYFWSANIAIKQVFFQENNGFCELFPYAFNEDQDLYYRLKLHTQIFFVKTAVVIHPVLNSSFIKLLNYIHPACFSYTVFILRHGNSFKVSNLFQFLKESSLFNIINLRNSLLKFDLNGIAISFIYLTYGSFILAIYYLKFKKNIHEI